MVPVGVGAFVDFVRAVGEGVAECVGLAVGVGECAGVRLGIGAAVLGALLKESDGDGVVIATVDAPQAAKPMAAAPMRTSSRSRSVCRRDLGIGSGYVSRCSTPGTVCGRVPTWPTR
jgi:hypothetical protein